MRYVTRSVLILLPMMLVFSRFAAGAAPVCPSVAPVSPLAVKDSTPAGRAFVSLAWVARDFSVTIRSTDSTDTCVFSLDGQRSVKQAARTALFSFEPGTYHVSSLRRHQPGTHSNMERADTVIDLKAGGWYIARFAETSVVNGGKSLKRSARVKAWRLSLSSAAKEKVVRHASGERPAVRSLVLTGALLATLLFGGLMLYAR